MINHTEIDAPESFYIDSDRIPSGASGAGIKYIRADIAKRDLAGAMACLNELRTELERCRKALARIEDECPLDGIRIIAYEALIND